MATAITTVDTAYVTRLLNSQGNELIRKVIQNFQTAALIRRFSGVKSTLDIATWQKDKRLITGYLSTGSAKGEEFSYAKVTLSVAKFMAILSVEGLDNKVEAFSAYLIDANENVDKLTTDMLSRKFFAWLVNEWELEFEAEMEDAIWLAIDTAGAADADMIHKFNGLRRQAAVFANGGNGTVVTTGAVTSANAMDKVELLYGGFDKQIKRTGAYIFCSYNLFDNYKIHYRTANSGRELGVTRLEGTNYEAAPIYLGGGKTMLVPVQGIGTDDVLIGCRPQDIALGYDTLGMWSVQERGFTLLGYRAMKFGTTFLQQKAGYLVVNDRLIAVEITTPRTNS